LIGEEIIAEPCVGEMSALRCIGVGDAKIVLVRERPAGAWEPLRVRVIVKSGGNP
jgi:hypothetical protein